MVAPSSAPAADTAATFPQREIPIRSRSRTQHLTRSLVRAGQFQLKLLGLKARILAKKLILSAALSAGAILFGLVGLVFTYIFLFRLLTDVAGLAVVWTWLIFAAVHVLTAMVFMLIVANIWKSSASKEAKP